MVVSCQKSKNPVLILVFILSALLLVPSNVYAREGRVLTDEELDEISAGSPLFTEGLSEGLSEALAEGLSRVGGALLSKGDASLPEGPALIGPVFKRFLSDAGALVDFSGVKADSVVVQTNIAFITGARDVDVNLVNTAVIKK